MAAHCPALLRPSSWLVTIQSSQQHPAWGMMVMTLPQCLGQELRSARTSSVGPAGHSES